MSERFRGTIKEAKKVEGDKRTYWIVSFWEKEKETFICFNPTIEKMVGQEIEGEIIERISKTTGQPWKQFSFSAKEQFKKEEGNRTDVMILSYAKDLSISASTLATGIVKSLIESGIVKEHAEVDLRKYHALIQALLIEDLEKIFELLKKINNGRALTSSSQED